MLDFLLGSGFLLALVRGCIRGFVRGAISLLVMLAAVWLGYRSGPSIAEFMQSWSGAGPIAARVTGSLLVFAAVLVAGAFVAHRFVGLLGPLRVFDRIAGSLVAGIWYVVVVTLVILLAGAAPNLPGIAQGLLSGSRVAVLVKADRAPVIPAVSRLLGDRTLESFVNLNRLVGQSRVVIEGADRVEIPLIEPGEIHDRPESARALFEKLNVARFEEGVAVLSWSAALAGVAGRHGEEMYEEGYFSHLSPSTGSVDRRVREQGIPFRVLGENLALSPTVDSVHVGLLGSASHRATMLDPRFSRVGISALEGPLGLMVVEVFSG